MSNLLVALLASAFALVSESALADDKTSSFETKKLDSAAAKKAKREERQKALSTESERQKALTEQSSRSDPYGATPVRTPKGTPLIGDFDRKDRQRVTPDPQRAMKKGSGQ